MKMKLAFATTALLAFSSVSAVEVANNYGCSASLSPERAVQSMIQGGVLEAKWFANFDSVAYFAAKPGHTAFGFPLVAVVAFQERSAFFGRSPGTSPGNQIALLIQASAHSVKSVLAKRKLSVAKPSDRSYPRLTVDPYAHEFAEELPKSADPRFMYTQVMCRIGV